MMDDSKELLRRAARADPDGWLHAILHNSRRMHERAFSNLADAAKLEIARRDARIAELEAALRPFADEGGSIEEDADDDDDEAVLVKVRHFRRAAAALGEKA